MKTGDYIVNVSDKDPNTPIGYTFKVISHSGGSCVIVDGKGEQVCIDNSDYRLATDEEKESHINLLLKANKKEKESLEKELEELKKKKNWYVGDRFRVKSGVFTGMEVVLSKLNDLYYLVIYKKSINCVNDRCVGEPWETGCKSIDLIEDKDMFEKIN